MVISKLFWMGMGLMAGMANAAPRMDTAIGTGQVLLATIVPDHEVANLYYVFPQSSEIVTLADGRLDFLYMETIHYRSWGPNKIIRADARASIRTSIQSEALSQKMALIQAENPNARFAVVTAYKTEVRGDESTDRYFADSECSPLAGPLEAPVDCRMSIYPKLTSGFKTIIKKTNPRVFHYVYHFYGVAGGKLESYQFAVPLRVGALKGKGYFIDQHGHEL